MIRIFAMGLVLSMFISACDKGAGPLEFTLTFKNAKALQPGQFVVYNGVRIGEVLSVELGDDRLAHVRVRIDDEHRTEVYREARFVIDKPGGLLDVSGERQVTMKDPWRDEARTPMAPADVVAGSEGLLGDAVEAAKGTWESTAEARERLTGFVDELNSSEEGRQLIEKIQDYGRQAGELGKAEIGEFRREQLPEIQARAEDLRRSLEEEGLEDKAEELWRRFSEWQEEVSR